MNLPGRLSATVALALTLGCPEPPAVPEPEPMSLRLFARSTPVTIGRETRTGWVAPPGAGQARRLQLLPPAGSQLEIGYGLQMADVNGDGDALDAADGLLVSGASLRVFSGFRFARHLAERDLPVAAVNLGKTRADDMIGLKLTGDAAPVLGQVAGLRG